MTRSFDRLARSYQTLERTCFGSALQSARESCLPYLSSCERGLLIGDGDGRFSSKLLESNRRIRIDSIDISPAMLAIARKRAGDNANRLSCMQADAVDYQYPKSAYDFIGLHFCLDCFEQQEVDRLIGSLAAALQQNGIVAYSDFCDRAPWQGFVVRLLYFCFRATTGLKARRLPSVVWPQGFARVARSEFRGGLVFSETLRKAY